MFPWNCTIISGVF